MITHPIQKRIAERVDNSGKIGEKTAEMAINAAKRRLLFRDTPTSL